MSVIKTNIESLKTLNLLENTSRKSSDIMEKLSSGLRINRAADDAAGLAISIKMRAQIRGLTKAEQNIDDGISMFNVAEGGMSQVEELVHRIRELAVQSSNDTYTDDDREKMQKEVNSLINGIDNIANFTEFNTHKVLLGEIEATTTPTSETKTVAAFVSKNTLSSLYTNMLSYVRVRPDANPVPNSDTNSTGSKSMSTYFYIDGVAVPPGAIGSDLNTYTPLIDYFLYEYDNNFENFVRTMDPLNINNAKHFIDTIAYAMNKVIEYYYPAGNLPKVMGHVFENTGDASLDGKVGLYLTNGGIINWGDNCNSAYITNYTSIAHDCLHTNFTSGSITIDIESESQPNTVSTNKYIIQVGANEGQNILFEIPPMPSNIVGEEQNTIDKADVSKQDMAEKTISLCDISLKYVSDARTLMGSYINRLEYAKSSVTNYNLNITNAESRIRDADISKNILEQVKLTILTQSTIAMMAQANHIPEGILKLL